MNPARRAAAALALASPFPLAVSPFVVAALAGCAGVPREGEGWIAGRLSLSVAALDTRPAQNLTVSFELRGNGERGELRLFTPIGTQIAAARWAPGRAMLATSEGTRSFDDLDALAVGALGEPVPLAALPDWFAGRAWPAAPSTPRDAGFEQLGWSVDLSRGADGRIVARRAAPPAVLLRVQLERAAG